MVRTVSKNKYLLWKWSEKPSRLIFTRVSPFLIKWEGLKMKVRHVPSFELPHNKGCICVKGRHVKPCMTPLKCTPWLDTRQCVYICSEVSYPNKPTWISPTPRLRCLPRRISPVRRPSSTFVGDQCSCQVHHTSATSRLGNEWRIQDHPFVKHKNDSSRNQAGWDFVNDIGLQSCAFDPDLKWTYGIPCQQFSSHNGRLTRVAGSSHLCQGKRAWETRVGLQNSPTFPVVKSFSTLDLRLGSCRIMTSWHNSWLAQPREHLHKP